MKNILGILKNFVPVYIIAGFLVVAIGGGVALGAILAPKAEKEAVMIPFEVNNVNAEMVSSTDGRKYKVSIDLYLELSEEFSVGMNAYVTRKQLSKNLSGLDYDIVSADDGMGYVTEQIVSWFSEDIEEGRDVGDVYVSNMTTGNLAFFTPAGEEDDAPEEHGMDLKTQQRFNALFKSAE